MSDGKHTQPEIYSKTDPYFIPIVIRNTGTLISYCTEQPLYHYNPLQINKGDVYPTIFHFYLGSPAFHASMMLHTPEQVDHNVCSTALLSLHA